MNNLNYYLFDFLDVCEKAAVASAKWIGKNDEISADNAAVQAMRTALNKLPIKSTIVIGEGERDSAPMLYIGEELGAKSNLEFDIAVDPLEGTTICAKALSGSMAVLAYGYKGSFLNAPDIYMEKIAVGPGLPENIISLDYSISKNLTEISKAKNKAVNELMVTILDRPRHIELIKEVRATGARIKLISDGDISAVLQTTSHTDLYVGSGGAPEGVLAAVGITTTGGQMEGRLLFKDEEQKARAKLMQISDFNKIYQLNDLVKKDAVLILTNITDGQDQKGIIKSYSNLAVTSTIYNSLERSVIHLQKIIKI